MAMEEDGDGGDGDGDESRGGAKLDTKVVPVFSRDMGRCYQIRVPKNITSTRKLGKGVHLLDTHVFLH